VPAPRVLLVRFGALGDVILATPLVRALRRALPDAAITFVTKARYAPILAYNPHLTAVATLGSETSLRLLAATLRRARWDQRLDLHGSLRSRALRRLAPGPWRTYAKRWMERTVLIITKRDIYRGEIPVAERYFEAARGLEVDLLVNNAGLGQGGRFHEQPRQRLLDMVDLNVRALTDLLRRFLPPMVARGRGAVVNVASMSSFQPVPYLAAYAATKAYVLSLTESLSVELAGTGVAVRLLG